MNTTDTPDVVSLYRFNRLLSAVVTLIQSDPDFRPDTILALSTGGFPVAAALAKRFGIKSRHVVGLPVYHDDHTEYELDSSFVELKNCSGRVVLVVDEASNTGRLTAHAVAAVRERGGVAKSCVLLARADGLRADYYAETCPGKPPKFYWELNETQSQ
jgi:hypoxanthine phosphoribosyltransferase